MAGHPDIRTDDAMVNKYWGRPEREARAPSFYNNMELVSVPFFQRPAPRAA